MTGKIDLQNHSDGIAVITFDHPDALNALSIAMMRSFAGIVTKLHADSNLRAVILTGAGEKAFCSGGDLFELSKYPAEEDALNFITIMGDALDTLEKLPVPVIAAINGYALGGGSEIAVACDMRIVDENARLGFVQILMALSPGWGAGQRLLRLVGYPKTMKLLLSGNILHPEELEQLGLIDDTVAPGKALAEALAYARKDIIPNSQKTIRAIKTLLRAGLDQFYEDALQIERNLFPPLWTADAHIDAVNAFLEQKKAKKDD